jgi:hypothetical protein
MMPHAVEPIVWRLFQDNYSFASEIGHRITSALWKSRFRQQCQPFRGDSRGPGQSLEYVGGRADPASRAVCASATAQPSASEVRASS